MKRVGLEWQVWDTPVQFEEVASITTPPSGIVRVAAKDKAGTSALYLKDDAGSEREIGPANAVTGTGAASKLAFWTSASVISSDSSLHWDNTNKRLGVGSTFGTTTVVSGLEVRGGLLSSDSVVTVRRTAADASAPNLTLAKTRGVIGTEVAVSAADNLGALVFQGWGTSFITSAFIRATANQAWTATAAGTFLTLFTTPDDSITAVERFRIGAAGQFGIGGATFGTANQAFLSGGASAAPAWTSLDHGTHLAGLTDDDHTQYLKEKASGGGATEVPDHLHTSAQGGNLDWDEVWADAVHTHQSNSEGATLDHGLALTGLTDDDHTVYALLAGRSGGQTFQGGTAASEKLILHSTSHATKGDMDLHCADLTFLSAARARMASQNRFRYLNSMAKAIRSATQSIPNGTFTVISLTGTDDFDTDGLHDPVTNSNRVNIAITGKYLLVGSISWDTSTAGTIRSTLIRDELGVTMTQNTQAEIGTDIVVATTVVSLTAGKWVEILGYQDIGINLDTIGVTLSAVYLGE